LRKAAFCCIEEPETQLAPPISSYQGTVFIGENLPNRGEKSQQNQFGISIILGGDCPQKLERSG
jgi:hypothetical protein